ncbi:MAG: DUF4405 domain-containing protein [bacterium]|nr:DUF4405 domain-containing protein [bacterium]
MKKVKIVIDALMYASLSILLGYHITDNKVHEYLGIFTFALFMIHHLLNISYYKNLFKGKYNFIRVMSLVTDILMFVMMIGVMISSMGISSYVFKFGGTTKLLRSMHLFCTSWLFVLVNVHLALHIYPYISNFRIDIKKSMFEYAIYLISILLFAYGVYYLIDVKVWDSLFLLKDFKYYDYSESLIHYYTGYIASSFVVVMIIYLILMMKLQRKKAK